MGVGGGAAVTGNVLEHRQHAALLQPGRDGAGDGGDLVGRGAIGAVADHGVGALDRDIGQRQAVDGNAEVDQIGGDQARRQPRGFKAKRRLDVIERAEHRAGRIGRPVRRTEALHPAALLVDQHDGIEIACAPAQFFNQSSDLCGIVDVAFE